MTLKLLIGFVRTIAPAAKDGDAAGAPDYDVEFVCSTDTVDRADEVIDQDGWELDGFRTNPVFLAGHQHRLGSGNSPVIGSFSALAVEQIAEGRKGLVGRVRFADTELGREYRSLYRDRHMRAVSVGFMPLPGGTRTENREGKKTTILGRNELYEVSAVAVGCNADALARLHALGWDDNAQGWPSLGLPSFGDAALAEVLKAVREDNQRAAIDLKAWLLDQIDELKALLPDTLGETREDDPPAVPADRDAGAGAGRNVQARPLAGADGAGDTAVRETFADLARRLRG